jgi:hypothetical protein
VAVHVVVVAGANVQLKFVEAPAANVEEPPVHGAQPVPVTETPLMATALLFVSVTVMVTEDPAATVVPGVTLCVTRVVTDVPDTVIVPLVVSLAAGTALPNKSRP